MPRPTLEPALLPAAYRPANTPARRPSRLAASAPLALPFALLLILLALAAWLLAPSPLAAAGFDCAKAQAADEKAVCADPALSKADETMTADYARALKTAPEAGRDSLKAAQRAWLARRAACGADIACLSAAYAAAETRLTFALDGKCDACAFEGEDLAGIAPAQTADDCAEQAVASGAFEGADLSGADFTACLTKYPSHLGAMTWTAALNGARLVGAKLGGNVMTGVDLSGADLSKAELYRVDLSGATLSGAKLDGAVSRQGTMNGFGSDFSDADFLGARAEGAKLYGDFQGADFSGADLRGATVDGYAENAKGADMDAQVARQGETRFGGRVNLTGADLTGGSFFGQTAMTEGGFAGAHLCRTTLPDGTVASRDCD